MKRQTTIHLNSDLGEASGVYSTPMQTWRVAFDQGGDLIPSSHDALPFLEIIRAVSAINLACGFHAGDPLYIKESARLAVNSGCEIGAHPSFPDREGFGLRYMSLSQNEIKASIQYQVSAVAGIISMFDARLSHVKCHGALFNHSMVERELAIAVVESVAEYDPELPVYGLPDSALEEEAHRMGHPFIREAYADRAYNSDGTLVPRTSTGAMITDPAFAAERVLQMATEGTVTTIDGHLLTINPDTISIHADTVNAGSILSKILILADQQGIPVARQGVAR